MTEEVAELSDISPEHLMDNEEDSLVDCAVEYDNHELVNMDLWFDRRYA